MNRVVLADRQVGTHTVCGTDWPIMDQLVRVKHPGKRPVWAVVRGLCNGIPSGSTEYRTLREARKAYDGVSLVLARDCVATGTHGITGQDVDEGVLVSGTRVQNIVTDETWHGHETRFDASTDGGKTWYRHRTYESPHELFREVPR